MSFSYLITKHSDSHIRDLHGKFSWEHFILLSIATTLVAACSADSDKDNLGTHLSFWWQSISLCEK